MPGSQWAPAWVSWRHTDDDDYVGWAPLPPESRFNAEIGFRPWCDSYYDIGPATFAFIRIGDFGRPSYREYCLPPQQALLIMPRTNNISGEKPVKETGQGQKPPGTELKPFVQHPGTHPPPENRKLEEQKREAGPAENRKPEEASNKRPAGAEEKKAVTERGATERPKGQGAQRHAESKHAREAEKPGGHGEPQKGKKEESKAEPPPPPQAKEEHHNPHPEERVAVAGGSQHHAEPPKPHPPQQSHQAPPNNQKKKEEHKK